MIFVYLKRFNEWLGLKEKLHNKQARPLYFKEGDIWWCALGENVGVEINGKHEMFSRPVLVYKKLSHDGFIGIPLSTKNKKGSWYVSFVHNEVPMIAILSQIRFMSSFRMYEKKGSIDDTDFTRIIDGFESLYMKQKFPLRGTWENPKYVNSIEETNNVVKENVANEVDKDL